MRDTSTPDDIQGRVRVDERPRALATRLEAGEIAVIDRPDLDRQSALALAARQPAADLNAAPSATGRHKVLGAAALLDAGIPLIDDLGQDIMTLREGERIRIVGDRVLRDGSVVASGRRVAGEDAAAEDDTGLATQVEAFTASIDDYLALDGDLLIRGEGSPQLAGIVDSRPVLLVVDGPRLAEDLAVLGPWRKEAAPIVVAVDAGADAALAHRITPHVVVGDATLMGEKAIRKAKRVVVRVGSDGIAPGRERLDRMGVPYETVTMSGSAQDAACVVATHAGASAIVTAGMERGLDDFLDQGRAAMAPAFFSRLVAGDLLIAPRAVAATHKPRPRGWALVLLAVVALVLMGAALWSTPWGNDAFHRLFGLATHLSTGPGYAQALIGGVL